jgi:hypothetical protein
MLLADQGRQVTKIEPPGVDPFRFQPGYRGKRSAVLDFAQVDHREAWHALVRETDVVVESWPRTTEKLGIDWEALNALNARLVYRSITGFGRSTSSADRIGSDALVGARTGLRGSTPARRRPIHLLPALSNPAPRVRPGWRRSLWSTSSSMVLPVHAQIIEAARMRMTTWRVQSRLQWLSNLCNRTGRPSTRPRDR